MGERDDRMGDEANDRTSNRANDRQLDDFDRDLERDNRRQGQGSAMGDLAGRGGSGRGENADSQPHTEGGEEHRQHARQGQAQSPRELTHNEPPKKKEGHR